MAKIIHGKKACAVNPLKMSQPLGASAAFLGIDGCMPVMHGSQGCTSFGLVLLVRHFRETIPLQTTAMTEVATVLGGLENLEAAILNIHKRASPRIIGICSTGVTETKGDDVDGFLKNFRAKHPELDGLALVYVSTPDFSGAFQDGWAKCVSAMIRTLTRPAAERVEKRINVLAGAHLTVADIEEIRETIEAFGLEAVMLPDLSGSLDGHIPETFLPHTLGGTPVEAIENLGSAAFTIAIGAQMAESAALLGTKTGVPYTVFDRLTGLDASDRFMTCLSELSGRPVPNKYRRQRSQLCDAMLDGHFFFGNKRTVIGAEPDLLWALGNFLTEMGCQLVGAVTTTDSAQLAELPCDEVLIGDLEDLETLARERHAELMVTHSHGRQAAERLGIAFHRAGLPLFDRIGAAHKLSVGYRGTRDLVFEVGNLLISHMPHHHPDDWVNPEAGHVHHAS